jgi:phosphoribulokinase
MEFSMQLIFTPFVWRMMERRQFMRGGGAPPEA